MQATHPPPPQHPHQKKTYKTHHYLIAQNPATLKTQFTSLNPTRSQLLPRRIARREPRQKKSQPHLNSTTTHAVALPLDPRLHTAYALGSQYHTRIIVAYASKSSYAQGEGEEGNGRCKGEVARWEDVEEDCAEKFWCRCSTYVLLFKGYMF